MGITTPINEANHNIGIYLLSFSPFFVSDFKEENWMYLMVQFFIITLKAFIIWKLQPDYLNQWLTMYLRHGCPLKDCLSSDLGFYYFPLTSLLVLFLLNFCGLWDILSPLREQRHLLAFNYSCRKFSLIILSTHVLSWLFFQRLDGSMYVGLQIFM